MTQEPNAFHVCDKTPIEVTISGHVGENDWTMAVESLCGCQTCLFPVVACPFCGSPLSGEGGR